jgi:uncharacterized protein
MPIYLSIPVLFLVGVVSGFVNVMAGGGSTLALPVLIFLGLGASAANGTNRVAIVLQSVSAVYSFKREKQHAFRQSLVLSLFGLPGAVAGAIFAVEINNALFEKILGVILIGVIVTMLLPRSAQPDVGDRDEKVTWQACAAMIFIGFYGGFIQVGVGFLLMAALRRFMRLNLSRVNMHKVFVILVYTIPALVVFACTGNVDWVLGLSLAAGSAAGAWWAAKSSVRKGEKVIRAVLVVAVLIMALKLLGVF